MGSTKRVKEFIDYKGITKYKFCIELGFSNKFLDNSSNMGTDKACKILHHFPELNAFWLLTGMGEMLNPDNKSYLLDNNNTSKIQPFATQEIPLFNLESISNLKELLDFSHRYKIIDIIKIPNSSNCDGAFFIADDSMFPILKNGDIVLYEKIDLENIFFGEIYLLSLQLNQNKEVITIKYIQKSEKGEGFFKLASENPNYQAKDVLISKITALAHIKISIRKNVV